MNNELLKTSGTDVLSSRKKLRKTLWEVDAPLVRRRVKTQLKRTETHTVFDNPNLSVSNHWGRAQIITRNHF